MLKCRIIMAAISGSILVIFATVELTALASSSDTSQAVRSWMLTLALSTLGAAGVLWVVEELQRLYDEVHELIIRGRAATDYNLGQRETRSDHITTLYPEE